MKMATSSEPRLEAFEENQLSIKLSGDNQDIQITEEDLEETESDDEDSSSSRANALSTLPQGLVKPPGQPTFGSVQVTESENVHFGDNITGDNIVFNFKGPVVIKQVVHPKEQDNPGYEQTEDDAPTNNNRPHKTDIKEETKIKTLNLNLWMKLSFSAVCIVIVGGICAIVTVTLTYTGQGNTKAGNDEQDSATADPLLIAPTHLRIVSRTEWLAQPVEQPLDKIRLPVPWVIIQHTATESCYSQSECILSVRLIQMFHVESRKWFDIGYNFLVAGDGSAYLGRGWEYQGAHTLGYNRYSMGIAFIGTFNNEPPPKKQLDACKKLIKKGVELGKIAKDYKLFAHRQLASTLSPGDKLYDILKEWPNFVKNATDIEKLLPDY